ncbi:hypothetical protein KBX50_08335 [Micromonospora sp. C51]|uniref:hypothetical protein n=1 Tax=Micromonospora sp. C51 TaxID=2824879 RepID=UPI001B36D5E8|nr:hypothetical protein [Micromonospora sp. C51]MBQ1048472.1 hypothetical protein [Micromonospora sp. C51]
MSFNQPAPGPVWRALLEAGGNLPVDEKERARYARVQESIRAAYWLPPEATEEELAEVRDDPHDPRPIEALQAVYLKEYADRLDPNAALDDVDRAALPWRTLTHAEARAAYAAAAKAASGARQPPTEPPRTADPWIHLLHVARRM